MPEGTHTEPVTADIQRYADWLEWLSARAAADDDVLAVWVGGSAATGGWDEHSDLDVDALCTPGTVHRVYDRMLAAARADFDLADVWELPVSTYPDGRQCFLNLHARPGLLAQPALIIDLHLSDLSDEHRLVDARRHGRPIVLHDPDGLVELRSVDEAVLAGQIAEAIAQVRQRRATGEWLVNRAIRRGHLAEAVDLYLRFALAPVVRLVRVEHCPWRHDYGLRYLREDLPAEVAERVESLLPVNGELGELSRRCFAWLDELLLAEPDA